MKTKRPYSMARISVSLFICGMIVFLGFQVFGEEWTAEQKEVWESVQTNWETFKKGDVEAALAINHDEMIAWFPNYPAPIRKETMRNAYKNWFAWEKPISVKLDPLKIHIFNNVANVFYYSKYEARKGLVVKSRVLETWVKQDNKWLAIGSLTASCDKLPTCPY